jgi:hypothetical protein
MTGHVIAAALRNKVERALIPLAETLRAKGLGIQGFIFADEDVGTTPFMLVQRERGEGDESLDRDRWTGTFSSSTATERSSIGRPRASRCLDDTCRRIAGRRERPHSNRRDDLLDPALGPMAADEPAPSYIALSSRVRRRTSDSGSGTPAQANIRRSRSSTLPGCKRRVMAASCS